MTEINNDGFPALTPPEPEKLTKTQQKFADFVTRNTIAEIGPFTSRDHHSGTIPINPVGKLIPVDSAELEHYIFVGDLDDAEAEPITPYHVRSATFRFSALGVSVGALYLERGEWTYVISDSDEVTLTDNQAEPIIDAIIESDPTTK